jgi:uncharacterized protein
MTSCSEHLQTLKDLFPLLNSQYSVEQIGLFGSVARGEATTQSDVDIVIKAPPHPFALVHIKELLEEAFQCPVDVVRYRKNMNAFLKARIDKDVIYI